MIAWLTDIGFDEEVDCYKLYFDFKEFEDHNLKFFKDAYYPNKFTGYGGRKELYTAIEAGRYTSKLSIYYFECDNDPIDRYIEEI